MKKIVFGAALLGLLAGIAPADARGLPPDMSTRRTLFAPAGQRMLVLEAPLGMCFLNTAMAEEGAIFGQMQEMVNATTGGAVIAVFAPCMDTSNLKALMGGGGGDDGRMVGSIIWLNTAGDEEKKTPLSDYLDMQEAKFQSALAAGLGEKAGVFVGAMPPVPPVPVEAAPLKIEETKKQPVSQDPSQVDVPKPGLEAALKDIEKGGDPAGLPVLAENPVTGPTVSSDTLLPLYKAFQLPVPGEYVFDGQARRTAGAVTVGFTADTNRDYIERHTAGIAGTTLLNQVPVEVRLAYTQKEPYDRQKLEELMDKFMEQQATLNK